MSNKKIANTNISEDTNNNIWKAIFTILSLGTASILAVGGLIGMIALFIIYSADKGEHEQHVGPLLTGALVCIIPAVLGTICFIIELRYKYLTTKNTVDSKITISDLNNKIEAQNIIINNQSEQIKTLIEQNNQLQNTVNKLMSIVQKQNINIDMYD